ncbi:MAG: XRE family transcriptional regulator [Rubrobacteraceae bacterium]
MDVGQKLRKLRKVRGLKLQDLAQSTGLSASFLSMVETGKSDITLAKLQKIVQFYGITIGALLDSTETNRVVTRPHERSLLDSPVEGVKTELLVPDLNRRIEALMMTFEPGADYEGSLAHEGEEVIFIVEGQLELLLDGKERYVLNKGDTASYPSTRTHKFRNIHPDISILYGVVTPPTL